MIELPTETSPPTYMKMAMTPRTTWGYFSAPAPASIFTLANMRQMNEEKDRGENQEDNAECRYGTLTESAPDAPLLAKYSKMR